MCSPRPCEVKQVGKAYVRSSFVTDVTPTLTSLPLESLIVQCLSLNGQLSCYPRPLCFCNSIGCLMLTSLNARLIKGKFFSQSAILCRYLV